MLQESTVTDDVVAWLQEMHRRTISEIIRTYIDEHQPRAETMIQLYERYKDGEAPIKHRVLAPDKVNNRLVNDFFGDIIDTKIGYFIGHPISYSIDGAEEGDARKEALSDFTLRNYVEDLDSETTKLASICGYSGRLCYIDPKGLERVMNVPPWECIFIRDRSIDKIQAAIRYYPMTVFEDGEEKKRIRVELYGPTEIYFYLEGSDGTFRPDDTEQSPRPHGFDFIPLIEFPNNEERRGDCEKVLPLIDNYDRAFSDISSEIEEFRLAYMYMTGNQPDDKVIEKAMQTGVFILPPLQQGNREVGFITKNLNDVPVENHLNRLEKNIYKFGKSADFTDEQFAGNLSGVAMKYKLFGLETKCKAMERKFSAALRRQFQVICSAWNKKGIDIDYLDIWFGFKRNIAVDITSEADSTGKLRGHVSEETRLSLLSFVDDPQWEVQKMQEEQLVMGESISLEDEEDEGDGKDES